MNKLLFLIYFILIGGIWGLGYINQSSFEMISAICAALFWIAQIWLLFYLEKDEKLQKKDISLSEFFFCCLLLE